MSLNPLPPHELFEFGSFRLDTRARLLYRDGVPVPLPPKSYETLLHLVRNRDRAVPREELLSSVWPEVVVSEGSLTQAVFLLRKALGETDEDLPRFVATVPRVGYRFEGPVRVSDAGAAGGEATVRPPVSRRTVPAAVAAALLALLLAPAAWYLVRRTRTTSAPGPTFSPPALLGLVNDLPLPPDAERLLGLVDGSFVLASPGAYSLLRQDGALAPTRIPLAEGETLAGLCEEGLALVRKDGLVVRDPLKQTSGDVLPLPAGLAPAARASWRVSRDGRYLARRHAAGLDVLERLPGRLTHLFSLPLPARDGEAVTLTRKYLGIASGGGEPVRVFSLADGRRVLEAPFAELDPRALAIDDPSGAVAVAGRFDAVLVYQIGSDAAPIRIPRRGWTFGLAFVPDHPTLLASGTDGIAAYRKGKTVFAPASLAFSGPILADDEGVFVFSENPRRLAALSYSALAPDARVDARSSIFWAVAADADGRTVYAGGKDGRLFAYDVVQKRLSETSVHTAGIPSLLREGDHLASASDDKTVAVWELPGLRLVRRSTAHEFLVNDLQVAARAPGGPALVTSSSDGTLKTWSWPALEARETIETAALTGRSSQLHAVWAAPDLTRILAGTWDGALLDLTRDASGWRARRVPVRSGAVYRFAPLPKLGLVAAVGIYPHEVFVFDLAAGTIHPIETADLEAYWCVSDEERSELLVVGTGGISRYAFAAREEGGRRIVGYRLATRRATNMGLMSATVLPDGSLWAATESGTLLRFPKDAVPLDGHIVSATAY